MSKKDYELEGRLMAYRAIREEKMHKEMMTAANGAVVFFGILLVASIIGFVAAIVANIGH